MTRTLMVAVVPREPAPWSESERARQQLALAGQAVLANLRTDHQLVTWAKENQIWVRIDRTTDWGNPFVFGPHGDRDTVCESYRRYLKSKPSLHRRVAGLVGKVLGCWCYPQRCHGNVLIEGMKNSISNRGA
jgi:hypothetical protein